MGEISEMILDGTLCQGCGCLMEDLSKSAKKKEGGADNEYEFTMKPPGHHRTYKSCLKER